MRSFDIGPVGGARSAVGDRDHRDVLLDRVVGLRVQRGSSRRVGNCAALRERARDVVPLGAKAVVGPDTYATTNAKDSDALICHYDTAGKLLWSRVGQGPGIDYGLGIATDGAGNAFLTGEFSEVFSLGGKSLRSRGSTDVYVAKFDTAGALVWLKQSGGSGSDNAYVNVLDGRGGLLVAGALQF